MIQWQPFQSWLPLNFLTNIESWKWDGFDLSLCLRFLQAVRVLNTGLHCDLFCVCFSFHESTLESCSSSFLLVASDGN